MVDQPEIARQRRRWYQFRLRTLLVGIVLLAIPCAYVAHEAQIVAKRKAWIAAHPDQVVVFDFDSPYWAYWIGGGPKNPLSWLRQRLGDKPVYYNSFVDRDGALAALFPESNSIFDVETGVGTMRTPTGTTTFYGISNSAPAESAASKR